MDSRNIPAYLTGLLLLVLLTPLAFAAFDPSKRGVTTMHLFYPQDGGTIAQGRNFNVSFRVGCVEALCKHFVSKITITPESGLTPVGSPWNASRYFGDIGINITKNLWWIFTAEVPGTYKIRVETTSTTAESSAIELNVNVLSEGGVIPTPVEVVTLVLAAIVYFVAQRGDKPKSERQERHEHKR